MQSEQITYAAPTGKPLGTNATFNICATILIPVLNAITKRTWQGKENIPQTGPAIVISNHLSYADVLFFAQFLYKNGRAPRFIGKRSVFNVPVIGRILLAAGQIPVDRESTHASKALDHAVAALKAGHLIGIYPEGTRSPDGRLYKGRTGIARMAIESGAPIIPVAMFNTAEIQPTGQVVPKVQRVEMVFGEPIYLTGDPTDQELLRKETNKIMETIAALSKQEYVPNMYASDAKDAIKKSQLEESEEEE